jgi:hypothetical protein
LLSEELAQAVGDPLIYNQTLALVGRYSLATVSPTAVALHRLVQAVIQARLGEEGEQRWAEVAVGLLRSGTGQGLEWASHFPVGPVHSRPGGTKPAAICRRMPNRGDQPALGPPGSRHGSSPGDGRSSNWVRGLDAYRRAAQVVAKSAPPAEAAKGREAPAQNPEPEAPYRFP